MQLCACEGAGAQVDKHDVVLRVGPPPEVTAGREEIQKGERASGNARDVDAGAKTTLRLVDVEDGDWGPVSLPPKLQRCPPASAPQRAPKPRPGSHCADVGLACGAARRRARRARSRWRCGAAASPAPSRRCCKWPARVPGPSAPPSSTTLAAPRSGARPQQARHGDPRNSKVSAASRCRK